MTKTRSNLIARVLQKLKVVGSGQTASAEDTQLVDGVIDPVMASLSTRGVFSWGDEDDLPVEAFEHLADLVGYACASDFGKQHGDYQQRMMWERDLRALELYSVSGQPQTTEYF